MPFINYIDQASNTCQKVDLCDKCYLALKEERKEYEVCVPCQERLKLAGVPMRQPVGLCGLCLQEKLLTHETKHVRCCESCTKTVEQNISRLGL